MHVVLMFLVASAALGLGLAEESSPTAATRLSADDDDATIPGTSLDLDKFLARATSAGIIDTNQEAMLRQLAAESVDTGLSGPASRAAEVKQTSQVRDEKVADKRASMFLRVYNHLTLLNLLYVSGAVVIMGAYTLFMTLAVERCDYAQMSLVMALQVAVLGGAGWLLWDMEDYVYLGGILCTISTGMVPFAVYNLQRVLKVWPKDDDPGNFVGFTQWIRGGWVIMEIATIVVGVLYLTKVRFPFLLFPVSFSLWYLSMDLAPLYPGWVGFPYDKRFRIRARISITVGVVMMLLGYAAARFLGSYPVDLGFWLYFFGLLTFWVSVNFDLPPFDLWGSLLLLVNLTLILIGSHLDRTTFHVFGTLGVTQYVFSICSGRTKMTSSVFLWCLKALVGVAVFSQTILRGGAVEILAGTVCMIAFNFNFVHFVSSSEFYSLLLLATNLGFVGIVPLFSQPLDFWFFTLPDVQPVFSFVSSLFVLLFHTKIKVRHLQKAPSSLLEHGFLLYRFLLSIGVSFAFVFLRQPWFSWVGGAGIPVVALCYFPRRNSSRKSRDTLVTFTTLLFSVTFSLFVDSYLLYVVCCLSLFAATMSLLNDRKALGCVLAVLLVLTSVPLNSKFVLSIGAMYMIFYLSYLAYDTFRDSLLFPLALICLGGLMILLAVGYQHQEASIHKTFYSFVPAMLKVIASSNIRSFWVQSSWLDWVFLLSKTEFTLESFLGYPFNWIMWSGALCHALSHGPAPYVSYVCGVCIVVLLLALGLLEVRKRMEHHLDDKIKVDSIHFSLSADHDGHGIIIDIKGSKPLSLLKPTHMALTISSGYFWTAAESAYGQFPVGLARSMFLPYTLTPHLISLAGFKKGSSHFTASILIGTGHKGSHKMKHSTATMALRKLSQHCVLMPCVVVYREKWYQPWSRLCQQAVDLKETLASLNKKLQ